MARAAPNASAADCSMFLRSMGMVDDIPLAWSAFMFRAQVLLRAALVEAEDIVSRADGTTKPWATSWSDSAVATAIVSFMMLQVVGCGLPCLSGGSFATQGVVALMRGRIRPALCNQEIKMFPSV